MRVKSSTLADTELFRATRLRQLLSEDTARIQAFDEVMFAERLYYERPADISFHLFRIVLQSNLELLQRLTDADWQRSGVHDQLGPFSMEAWLERAASHAHEHAAQIRALKS